MAQIMKVEDYNAEGEIRYQEAVQKWEPGKGGFPCRGIYLWLDEETGEKVTGKWVLRYDPGCYLQDTRESAQRLLKDLKRKH